MPVIDQLILILLGTTLGMVLSQLIATTPRKERK